MIDDVVVVARGARYAAARALTGLSQRALAKRLKVSPQAVSKWESGRSEPTKENVRALADLSGCSVEWLLTGRDRGNGGSVHRSNVEAYTGKGRLVPEVGDTVQGVLPVSKRVKPGTFVQTYFPCSSESFALTVSGDSMETEFRDGDVVVIDPKVEPVPGDYVFVELGETKLFRRYRPQTVRPGAAAHSYDLVPSNPDWPTVHITPSDKAVIKGVMTERTSPRRKA